MYTEGSGMNKISQKEKIIINFKIDHIEYSVLINDNGKYIGLIFDTQIGTVNEFELKNIDNNCLFYRSNDSIKKFLLESLV